VDIVRYVVAGEGRGEPVREVVRISAETGRAASCLDGLGSGLGIYCYSCRLDGNFLADSNALLLALVVCAQRYFQFSDFVF